MPTQLNVPLTSAITSATSTSTITSTTTSTTTTTPTPPPPPSTTTTTAISEYELWNSTLDKLGIPKGILGLAICFALVLIVFILSGPQLFGELIGVLYPLFSTLKTVESLERSECIQWLFYWCIFGCFSLFESFEAITHFLPVFFTVKIVLLIWAQHPQTRGAEFLYQRCSPAIIWLIDLLQHQQQQLILPKQRRD